MGLAGLGEYGIGDEVSAPEQSFYQPVCLSIYLPPITSIYPPIPLSYLVRWAWQAALGEWDGPRSQPLSNLSTSLSIYPPPIPSIYQSILHSTHPSILPGEMGLAGLGEWNGPRSQPLSNLSTSLSIYPPPIPSIYQSILHSIHPSLLPGEMGLAGLGEYGIGDEMILGSQSLGHLTIISIHSVYSIPHLSLLSDPSTHHAINPSLYLTWWDGPGRAGWVWYWWWDGPRLRVPEPS